MENVTVISYLLDIINLQFYLSLAIVVAVGLLLYFSTKVLIGTRTQDHAIAFLTSASVSEQLI